MKLERLGPYCVVGDLGQGGMGSVYLAEVGGSSPGLESGARVALKVIHPHLLETPGFFKRFLREAEIGRAVQHDNVVRFFDCDAVHAAGDHHHFLVMEYVEGQTLRSLLDDLRVVPEELCRHVAREIAKGLGAIHAAGVVHRDLKPENVLITDDHVVKIMDLGVARLQDEAIRLSQSGVFVGSVLYAAPEAFRGGGAEVDGRADLYSLGVLLYELATGRHPYEDSDVRVAIRQALQVDPRRAGAVNPQLSPFFEEVVHGLLAKQPGSRFGSTAELLAILETGEDSAWWQERKQAIRLRTRRPLRRIRIPRETSVYGRDEDLARMRSAYEAAREGNGRVLLVEGEAGIGKTRVVDEFVRKLEEGGEDFDLIYGSYPPGGAATGAGAFSAAYREHFGSGALEETLSDFLPPTSALAPAFAALLRGEPPPPGNEPLTRDSLQTVFVHATRALAAQRPTIVLIDDLHFAPDEGRALFAALAHAAADHRILLIGTTRRGVSQSWISDVMSLDHAERLELQRLGPKDLARLLEGAFRSRRLAVELGHDIAVKSDGNPYFAFEIVRGLKEGRTLTQSSDGTWVTTGVVEPIQVPSTVVDLVRARVAALSEEERDVLDVAACCGYEFDPEWIAEALGMAPVVALRAFGRIERLHRLVRTAGRSLVFDHHHVQESLYESLIPQLREAYHAALAVAWEARVAAAGGGVRGSHSVLLCEHFLKGKEAARALPYLDSALDHLEGGYLNAPALDLLDRALAVEGLLVGERRIRSLLRKSRRLEILGNLEEQHDATEEALALLTDETPIELALQVRIANGNVHDHLAAFDRARTIFEECIRAAQAAGERQAEAIARGHLGNAVYSLGRYADARAEYEATLAILREIGDRSREAMAIGSLGNVYGVEANYTEASRCFHEMVAIARETGERRAEGGGYGNLGVIALCQGKSEEARGFFERKLAIAQETGDRHAEAYAMGHLGTVLLGLGRCEEACEYGERYLAITEETGDRQGHAMAAGYLGDTYQALGRGEEAYALFERQLLIAEEIQDPLATLRAKHSLGDACLALGRIAEAKEKLDEANRMALETEDRHASAYLARDLGDLCLLLGDARRAEELFGEMREFSHAAGDVRAEGYALLGLARVAERGSDLDAARELATRALAIRREGGDPAETATALTVLGEIELEASREEEAVRLLDEAWETADAADAFKQALAAGVRRLVLPGGNPKAVRETLSTYESRLPVALRMDARYGLWRATGDQEHLSAAKRLLETLLAHAPDARRSPMREEVPLHRRILSDAREQGLPV